MTCSRVLFLLGVLLAVEARSVVARGRKLAAARKHSTRNGPIQSYGAKWRGNSPALKAQARLPRTNAPSPLRKNSTGVNGTKIDCPCLHNRTGDRNQTSTFSHARMPRSQNRSDQTSDLRNQLPRNFVGPKFPPEEKHFKLKWPSPAPQPARTSWPTMPTESPPTTSSQASEANVYGTYRVPRAKQRVQKSPPTSDHGGTRYTPEPEPVPQNSFSSSGARSSPSNSHAWRRTSNRPRLRKGNGLSGSLGFLRHHRGDKADPEKNPQNRTKPELSQETIPSQISIPKMPLGLEHANTSTVPENKGTEPPTSSSLSLNSEDKNGLAKETELLTSGDNGQEIIPTTANSTIESSASKCTPCAGPGKNSTCPNPSEVCRLLPRVGKFDISAARKPVGTFFCSVVVGLWMPCGLRTTADGSECSVCKEGYSCRVLDAAKFSRERVPVCAPLISRTSRKLER